MTRRARGGIAGVGRSAALVCAGALLGFGGGSPVAAAAQARGSSHQSPFFSADVRRGPDAGLALWGYLHLRLAPSGRITGKVVHRGGVSVPASGHVSGHTLQLSFRLPNGLVMSGTGTAARAIHTLSDLPLSGTLSGPRPSDHGNWALRNEAERHALESPFYE
jgi:hypothetical protein